MSLNSQTNCLQTKSILHRLLTGTKTWSCYHTKTYRFKCACTLTGTSTLTDAVDNGFGTHRLGYLGWKKIVRFYSHKTRKSALFTIITTKRSSLLIHTPLPYTKIFYKLSASAKNIFFSIILFTASNSIKQHRKCFLRARQSCSIRLCLDTSTTVETYMYPTVHLVTQFQTAKTCSYRTRPKKV